jgi:hypothetical protein
MADYSAAPGGVIYADMTLLRGVLHAVDEDTKQILFKLATRVSAIRPHQDRLRQWCDRADRLYYAEELTDGGADLWAKDPSATIPGRSHVSINTPAVYVDVPAALQAVDPIENMLATDTTKEARDAAAALERLYTSWKQEEDFDLKWHKACTVKSLYGITAARIAWDEDTEPGEKGHPEVEVVEQPRNLHLGWKSDSYDELEWVAYVTRYEPNALCEEFGVDVQPYTDEKGVTVPLVGTRDFTSSPQRPWLSMGDARVEVWDYWYRQPVWKGPKLVRMDTYNVVIAGNLVIRGPLLYKEYQGDLPYVPLFNTFIPGMPQGRSDLYDVEHLIREKYETVTAGSQMIHNGIAGDFWQLTGPDAPTRVPAGLKPKRNEMVAPGPGNRIETITPYIAQFQLEQYLGRLDREMAAVSGLNDLLLGLAPAQVLSSSKAINALIANYESRLSMRRKMLYKWRREVWELALKVWKTKDKDVKTILAKDNGFLDIIDPSLSPRDEQETAVRAANLVNAKLWSQARGMDAVGVDDPETEQQLIREESTDATLWPERVQVMAQLMAALQSLGLNAPAGASAQAAGQAQSGQEALRKALGAQTPTNTPASGGPGGAPEAQGQTPPIPGAPPEAGGAAPPFAQGPGAGPATGGPAGPEAPVIQGMLQGGVTKGRILTQQKLGRR